MGIAREYRATSSTINSSPTPRFIIASPVPNYANASHDFNLFPNHNIADFPQNLPNLGGAGKQRLQLLRRHSQEQPAAGLGVEQEHLRWFIDLRREVHVRAKILAVVGRAA